MVKGSAGQMQKVAVKVELVAVERRTCTTGGFKQPSLVRTINLSNSIELKLLAIKNLRDSPSHSSRRQPKALFRRTLHHI